MTDIAGRKCKQQQKEKKEKKKRSTRLGTTNGCFNAQHAVMYALNTYFMVNQRIEIEADRHTRTYARTHRHARTHRRTRTHAHRHPRTPPPARARPRAPPHTHTPTHTHTHTRGEYKNQVSECRCLYMCVAGPSESRLDPAASGEQGRV